MCNGIGAIAPGTQIAPMPLRNWYAGFRPGPGVTRIVDRLRHIASGSTQNAPLRAKIFSESDSPIDHRPYGTFLNEFLDTKRFFKI
jgi:hypothetical protein